MELNDGKMNDGKMNDGKMNDGKMNDGKTGVFLLLVAMSSKTEKSVFLGDCEMN